MTGKILESVFLLQISQTRVKPIILIHKNVGKGVKLSCNSCYEIFLAVQYIL